MYASNRKKAILLHPGKIISEPQHCRGVDVAGENDAGTFENVSLIFTFKNVSLESAGKVPDSPWLEGFRWRGRPVGDWLWFGLIFDQIAVHPSHQRLVVVYVALNIAWRVFKAFAHAVQLVEPLHTTTEPGGKTAAEWKVFLTVGNLKVAADLHCCLKLEK